MVAENPRAAPVSVTRSAASFGLATVLGHLSQFLWLIVGVRVMPATDFGAVLAAQALYGVLQISVDIGTNAVGARIAARGEVDARRRGEIVRMRILFALAAAPVAIGLGLLKISGSLEATLPYVLALGLLSVLNVWEPYGSGDVRPWATYMFARSGVLAAIAFGFLVAGGRFPVPLAGTLECLVIVFVMVAFGSAPLASLWSAAAARGGPWRSVLSASGPAFTAQSSMAAGTLVLSGSGSPAAAGAFAACVRLLSGVNAINGIVATSLYPRLARGVAGGSDADRRVLEVALRVIALIAVGATAVCVVCGSVIATALLGEASEAQIDALVLTMAAASPLGNVVMLAFQMLARGHERATVLPFVLGALVTVGLAVVAVAVAGPRVDLVAASLLTGQLTTMGGLGLRIRSWCPDVAVIALWAMAVALLTGLLACAALIPGGTMPAGILLLLLAGALATGLRPLAGSLLLGVRRRRTRASTPTEAEDHAHPAADRPE